MTADPFKSLPLGDEPPESGPKPTVEAEDKMLSEVPAVADGITHARVEDQCPLCKNQDCISTPLPGSNSCSDHSGELAMVPSSGPVLQTPTGHIFSLVAQRPEAAERWVQGISTLRRLSVKQCRPSDFRKSKTSTDEEVATIVASGARKIMSTMIIEAIPSGEPEICLDVDGSRTAYVTGRGKCYVNGVTAHGIYAARNEHEEFVGRKVRHRDEGRTISTEAIALIDLRSSARSLFDRKVVEALLGIGEIPLAELREVYGINTDLIPEGQGFGTADDRRAAAVAEDGVEQKTKRLWEVLLQVKSGSQEEARTLLQRITKGANPNPETGKTFPGHTSVARITKIWQVESAIERLKRTQDYINFRGEKNGAPSSAG